MKMTPEEILAEMKANRLARATSVYASDRVYAVIDHFEAALASQAQSGETPAPPPSSHLAVKPLEWNQLEDGRYSDGLRPGTYYAEYYRVSPASDGTFRLDDGKFTFFRQRFGSVPEAQSAAQVHFEGRIRAALAATATEDGR